MVRESWAQKDINDLRRLYPKTKMQDLIQYFRRSAYAIKSKACRLKIKRLIYETYERPPILQRFWSKVEKTDTCWLWIGSVKKGDGYGHFWDGQKVAHAHRWSYEYFNQCCILPGHQIHHTCKNPACVNPKHLVAVSPQQHSDLGDNGSYQRNQTHCKRGHVFNESNIYWDKYGHRQCRTCRRLHKRRMRQRQRNLLQEKVW